MSRDKTLFDHELSDSLGESNTVSKQLANQLFDFFRNNPLFKWEQANNDCEDRANAVCILLEQWKVSCLKAWVFSGCFLKKGEGQLINNWNYHVAAAIPVNVEGNRSYYIIDPATLNEINNIEFWAANVTAFAHSHYLVKAAETYIFNAPTITKENWHKRNRQNYKWTIQGLAGINGVTKTGKAELVFKKALIKNTANAFQQLMQDKPLFL